MVILSCYRGYSDNTDLSDFEDPDEDEVVEVRGLCILRIAMKF